jgi:hypothetical protein
LLAARATGLDPEWPPVLIALVVVVLAACVVSVIVVLRAFRAETRGGSARRQGDRGTSR